CGRELAIQYLMNPVAQRFLLDHGARPTRAPQCRDDPAGRIVTSPPGCSHTPAGPSGGAPRRCRNCPQARELHAAQDPTGGGARMERTVLVADDNADNRAVYVMVLEHLGYRVV